MHTQACEATNLRAAQPAETLHLQMACLESRLTEVRTQVDVLAEADAAVTEKAVSAARSLKPLDRCTDPDALATEVRPPSDPDTAAKVKAQREKLARAKALEEAAKYKEGLAIAEEVVEAAKTIDYPPLLAEALARVGDLQFFLANYEACEKSLAEAYWTALEARHDDVMAHAASRLLFVVGHYLTRREHARQWMRHAEAAVRRVGLGGVEEARLLRNRGGFLLLEGPSEEACEYLERALVIFEQELGRDHPEVGGCLSDVGAICAYVRPDDAREHLERALAIAENAFGPNHPRVAAPLLHLAKMHVDAGQHDEARVYFERALTIVENVFGPDHIQVANYLTQQAFALVPTGDHDEARRYSERALAIVERKFGGDDPRVADFLFALGFVLVDQGEYEKARPHLERGLAIVAKGEHSGSMMGYLRQQLGIAAFKQGRYDEARRQYERAVAASEEALGPDHLELVVNLGLLGNALRAQGRYEEARATFERALAISESAHEPRLRSLPHAYALTGLGRVLFEQKEYAEALVVLERAVTRAEGSYRELLYTSGQEHVAEPRFALARTLWKTGKDRERALELAKKARDGFRERGKYSEKDLAEVEAWLRKHGGE
jgi:tetratricopeptide (TPR) repeat protein